MTDRFEEALRFASRLHREQKRKGTGVPYVAHLLAVAALVLEDGGGEEEAVAALLHDSIEDQGDAYPGGRVALRAELERRFGPAVRQIVDDCTDDDAFPKQEWRARKQHYLAHLAQAGPASRRVSAADKLHNARAVLADYRRLGEKLWTRFRTGSGDDQLWYYTELARAFPEGALGEELNRVVAELVRLRQSSFCRTDSLSR